MPANLLSRQIDSLRLCSAARPVSRWRKLQTESPQQLAAGGKAPVMAMGLKRRIELHVGTRKLLFSK